MAWITLCEVSELHEGTGKYVQIDGFELAVFLHQGKIYVLDNTCPHQAGPLAEGTIEDGWAVCPWHNWQFNLETGKLKIQDQFGVERYNTRVLTRPNHPDVVQADLPIY